MKTTILNYLRDALMILSVASVSTFLVLTMVYDGVTLFHLFN